MKLFVPKYVLNDRVKVYQETNTEAGTQSRVIYEGACNFNQKQRQILTPQKELVAVGGTVIIYEDILPGEWIDGMVEINGKTRQILSSTRFKNPDGTIYSTELIVS